MVCFDRFNDAENKKLHVVQVSTLIQQSPIDNIMVTLALSGKDDDDDDYSFMSISAHKNHIHLCKWIEVKVPPYGSWC